MWLDEHNDMGSRRVVHQWHASAAQSDSRPESGATGPVEISVCICTYRRPDLLRQALQSVLLQACDFSFEIVVVDNDAAGEALGVVLGLKDANSQVSVTVIEEKRRGISSARNAALAAVSGRLIAWIDDDEIACRDWLSLLHSALTTHKADAVFGPVLPAFPNNSSAWASRSGLFQRARFRTGERIDFRHARTGNALVKREWFTANFPAFQDGLGRIGGEDTDFFERIEAQGAAFVWCDEAEVTELIPLERQRLRWLLERNLRSSTNFWRKRYSLGACALCQVTIGIVFGVFFGVAGLIALPLGRHRSYPLWCRAMRCAGRVVARTSLAWTGY